MSRDTKSSVVVEWDRPKHHEDLLGYYVDCCVVGSNVWEPCNHKPIGYNKCVPSRSPPPEAPGRCLRAKVKMQNGAGSHSGEPSEAAVHAEPVSFPRGMGLHSMSSFLAPVTAVTASPALLICLERRVRTAALMWKGFISPF